MSQSTVRTIMRAAAVTTVATTAATAICGAIENGNAAAPVNAVSHIAWGDQAERQDGMSVKYTAVGALLNAGAMLSWAAVHHWLFDTQGRRRSPAQSLVRGTATAGIAYIVDYHVVPRRLTPGFETRLSNRSLFAIYAVLAASLALSERRS